ncbi:MAG: UDP-N-acetylmuramoyl-tripeptide--D-alanyl-D-alanine ligase, partial [Acidobacteriota bacterium]|nr:UDP-N-acetylmuramoyl-tripeptide--D-alanyl-D-alanine ligase [Acidobacteriota bacterium]
MNRVSLTFGDVAAATGGQLIGGQQAQPIEGISIDSRTLVSGDLFLAIRGDRFDGHRFVADAFARGALGAVVDTRTAAGASGGRDAGAGTPALITVEDTTRALQDVARDVRRRSGARVVAITGSAGKTTTKEIAAEFLAVRHQVYRNKGNLNNHIGLPLSLLELRSCPDVAVVELGMNRPGEIRTLVSVAEPDVRVWTNVGDAHMGFFDSPDAIADAKGEILEQARPGDVLVANADDPRIAARIGAFAGPVVTFGVDAPADVRASSVVVRGLEGTSARVTTPAGEFHLDTPLLGLANLSNVLAATAVALRFDVPLDAIADTAASLRPARHRGELLRLPGGLTLIDDSYNSSPSALRRALETVSGATGSARKIAVLGEMLELGAHAAALHEGCGRAAAAAGLHLLVTVGGDPARGMADAAVAAGMARTAVLHVPSSVEAAEVAAARTRPGDLVLVKGSRGIGT